MEQVRHVFEWCALATEVIGIGVILVAVILSIVGMLRMAGSRASERDQYFSVRQKLGRGIILGLEFLVAADIIHTVAVELNLETVLTLALIVIIRTFLSFTLEAELDGHWPWQKNRQSPNND